jgi:hypothetical protein
MYFPLSAIVMQWIDLQKRHMPRFNEYLVGNQLMKRKSLAMTDSRILTLQGIETASSFPQVGSGFLAFVKNSRASYHT